MYRLSGLMDKFDISQLKLDVKSNSFIIPDDKKILLWNSLANGDYNNLLRADKMSDGTNYFMTDKSLSPELANVLSSLMHFWNWFGSENDPDVMTWYEDSESPFADNGKYKFSAKKVGDLLYIRSWYAPYNNQTVCHKNGGILSGSAGAITAMYLPSANCKTNNPAIEKIFNIVPDKNPDIVPNQPNDQCPCKCYETVEEKRFYLVRECSGANCYPVKIDVSEQICDYNYQDNEFSFDCDDVENIIKQINKGI